MKVLLIIPAYNEQDNIERVIATLKRDCPQYDYLIINDGSQDDTENICRRKGYHFVSHPVNLGLAAAIQTGMLYAYEKGYDAAIQFDGDGQHDPDYIDNMAAEMEKGYNIVIGSRFISQKKPISLRMFGSNIYFKIIFYGIIIIVIHLITFKTVIFIELYLLIYI